MKEKLSLLKLENCEAQAYEARKMAIRDLQRCHLV